MLQEAAVGGYNGGGGYNISGCNDSGSYNIGGYTMVACRTLHKKLCWEFEVGHNCVFSIFEVTLMYVVTCLGTFCNFNRFL